VIPGHPGAGAATRVSKIGQRLSTRVLSRSFWEMHSFHTRNSRHGLNGARSPAYFECEPSLMQAWRPEDGPMAGGDNVIKLADAMHGADFVLIDGIVFETEYLRVPDEYTVADDVVLEVKRGDDEVAFTRKDVDDAESLGDGIYRLKSGALLRFLTSATVH
jgi:hypothetical protein